MQIAELLLIIASFLGIAVTVALALRKIVFDRFDAVEQRGAKQFDRLNDDHATLAGKISDIHVDIVDLSATVRGRLAEHQRRLDRHDQHIDELRRALTDQE